MISCPSSFDSRVSSAPNQDSRSSSVRALARVSSNSLRFIHDARPHPVLHKNLVLGPPPTKVNPNGPSCTPVRFRQRLEATVKAANRGARGTSRGPVELRLAPRTECRYSSSHPPIVIASIAMRHPHQPPCHGSSQTTSSPNLTYSYRRILKPCMRDYTHHARSFESIGYPRRLLIRPGAICPRWRSVSLTLAFE